MEAPGGRHRLARTPALHMTVSTQIRFIHAPLASRHISASAQQASAPPAPAGALTPALERSRDECLIQASIGVGERGRGLFFRPSVVAAGTTGPPAPAAGAQQPALLRVPLSSGLTLVTGGGPMGLQRKLLKEWQGHHGLELPERLAALLEDTERPPALRLAAWLLWASQLGGHPSVTSTSAASTPPGTGSRTPSPPTQPRPLNLADYARHVLPPLDTAASCLRLAAADAVRLPADAQGALADMRSQVVSYSAELRSLGLDWGCGDTALWWAFDMVISRSFAVTSPLPPPPAIPAGTMAFAAPSSASTSVPLALYVPWACLLNHSPSPNAAFQADLVHREFVVSPRLRFTPLEPGVELCISYGSGLDNVQQLVKYGFCTAGNVNDRLPVPADVAAAAGGLRRQTLCSVTEQLADQVGKAAAGSVGPDGVGTAVGAGRAGSSGGGEQQRNRVYSALATLLDPLALPPGSSGASSDPEIATAGSLATVLAWSTLETERDTANANTFPTDLGRLEDGRTPEPPIPEAVLLWGCPCLDAGVNLLHFERRLIAQYINDILQAYVEAKVV